MIRFLFGALSLAALWLVAPASAQTPVGGEVVAGTPSYSIGMIRGLTLDATGALRVTGGGAGGSGGSASNPTFTTPAPLSAAFAVIALPQGAATQIASTGLKRFSVQVQSTGRVLIGFDNTVCSAGYRLDGTLTATGQGMIQTWYPANASTYWACAPDAPSSVFVERGQ